MTANIIYIGLGSNSHDSQQKLFRALACLKEFCGVVVQKVSPVYETEPQGYAAQPWFSNQVARLRLESFWKPEVFLESMLGIEAKMGRIRKGQVRYGPRPIDLDLLLFGDIHMEGVSCVLPHPRMTERAFVLKPLLDIEPDIAIMGRPGKFWLDRLNWRLEDRRVFQSGEENNKCGNLFF